MSPSTSISQPAVVGALTEVWDSLVTLGGQLRPEEWDTPTALPGWTVKDVMAHIVGTESALEGQGAPASAVDVRSLAHVRNDVGALNEAWVESFRSVAPAEVLAQLRDVTGRRAARLRSMSAEQFEADSWTPAGPGTYGRFMQIRVYDCWVHEQDIRDAVGRPGHDSGPAAEQSLDEIVRALGYIVGKKAAAPSGSTVTIELTGPSGRTVHVAVDGRAAVVERLDRPADATIRMPAGLFVRLAAGRLEPEARMAEVGLEGDGDLGRRVVANLNFTI